MQRAMSFGEVLEAIDGLSLEEQEALIDIMRHRLAEQNRKRLGEEVQKARREFAEGQTRQTTVTDLMDEILS
jgi:hypothetical protein